MFDAMSRTRPQSTEAPDDTGALTSVILPTYNRLAYLKEALDSAIAQTYRNIEIIVHDNCSTQSPAALVTSYGDRRIRLYANPAKISMAANVIAGYRKARGKYVAALNDDDVWHPDFLAQIVPHLEARPDAVTGFCDHYVMDAESRIDADATEANSRRWRRHRLSEGYYCPFDEIALLSRSVGATSAAVFRREALDWDHLPTEIGYTVDLYVAYLAARTGGSCYYTPRRLTAVRVHARAPGAETLSIAI
jgi:glycosyltransferase involved in cell wall biosynthesis